MKTNRDKIWNATLEELVARGRFKAIDIMSKLDMDESQRQTVRRTLNALEKDGWLERESKQSSIWRLGWKGRMLLNVSEETIERARA
ncbi:helix-turn-helix domain-containing protein [Natrinema ejinorense]|uniref:Uncharacterized protein n=1 Tax=Natrinema ejinorense TaxID=373386 RepID=A0A2A5QS37_9EURY|nr:hypothetical protein [Natrinema ejinorense]PCR89656.1 hypothetical protein CP557_03355 [Natrinema ejinorense]